MSKIVIFEGPSGLKVRLDQTSSSMLDSDYKDFPNKPAATVIYGESERPYEEVLADGEMYQDGQLLPLSEQAHTWIKSIREKLTR